VFESETNFLWMEPPGDFAEHWFRGLKERGILVRYFPGPRTGRYLRVTVGSDAGMDRFLATVDLMRSAGR
jgi:histidinol-phosphate aminotransferase